MSMLSISNNKDQTALDVAKAKGNYKMLRFLSDRNRIYNTIHKLKERGLPLPCEISLTMLATNIVHLVPPDIMVTNENAEIGKINEMKLDNRIKELGKFTMRTM